METIEALKILEKIPEENWGISEFSNGVDKCCALGHLVRITENNGNYNFDCRDKYKSEVEKLRHKSQLFLEKKHGSKYFCGDIASINNGMSDKYQQSTPKKRVLALLKDMVNAAY